MKLIFIFLFCISTAVATSAIISSFGPSANYASDQVRDSTELSLDSASWFERNLDLYIQADYFSFDPVNYTQELTPGAKAELSLECWLGNFTVGDMYKEKNCVKVDFSNEEVKKVLFITPTFFVLTSYLKSENGMSYGSSLLYFPKTNTLKELESIIVFGLNDNNSLECSKEHFSELEGYVVEHGHFNIDTENFIVEFTE